MPVYDDGERFAVGDGLDRFDWSRTEWLRLLRSRLLAIPDDRERLRVIRRLIADLYGPQPVAATAPTPTAATGSIWLHDLPDVLAGAGLDVDVYPGWELRSRSSGGYDALFAVQVHHTASNADPADDMAWMWDSSPDAPIGAVHLARSGRFTVGAAGATNTSGKGGPLATSRGTIPLDSANRYVLSIEAANTGTGEAWPDVQIDAYRRGVRAMCDAYGTRPDHHGNVHAHWEWTSRKIDPAGASPYATGGASWDMDAFRSDVLNLSPFPDPGGPAMDPIRVRFDGYLNVFLLTEGGYVHLTDVLNDHFGDLPLIVSDAHEQGMKAACTQSGITVADLVPGGP